MTHIKVFVLSSFGSQNGLLHHLCHVSVFSKPRGRDTADGRERCSLTTSQRGGSVDVSTMGVRCNESREPLLLASIHPLGLPA